MRPSSTSFIRLLPLFLVLLLTVGCQQKTLRIQTNPPDAALTITRLKNNAPDGWTRTHAAPLSISLQFGEGITYKVEASKPQHDSVERIIGPEPKTESIELALQQYATNTDLYVLEPREHEDANGDLSLRLEVRKVIAEAYLDVREESKYVTSCEPLANSMSAGMSGLNSLASSRWEKQLVYDVIKDLQPEKYHTVTRDESLEAIAAMYRTSVRELRRLNNLSPQPLKAGERVRVAEQRVEAEMYLQNTSSATVMMLERDRGLHLFPDFVDAKAVVFTSDYLEAPGLTRNIWSISDSARGGSLLYQPQAAWQLYAPASSLQGNIAFTCLIPRQPTPHIWMLRKDAKSPDQVTVDGERPDVSPDGTRILFIRHFPQPDKLTVPGQIWAVLANGTRAEPILENKDYTITSARWSPDGKWIAYAANQAKKRDAANFDIFIVRADKTGNPIQLTTNGSWDDCPAWDKSGDVIYFRSNRGGQWRIWQMKLAPAALQEAQ